MPQNMTSLIGTIARRHHGGQMFRMTITATGSFEVYNETTDAAVGIYASATAAAQSVRGPAAVNGWDFWGLTNPNARRIGPRRQAGATEATDDGVKVGGKCQHEGCYEPADCKHGLCYKHCQRHSIGRYSDRRYPRNDRPHVGVEIEVVYDSAEHFRRGVGIDCHQDGSLGSYGAEYKVLAESTKVVAQASELVETLWKRRAKVDRRCGLHVHLDTRQLGPVRIEEMLDWAQRTQDEWFSMMPPSRRANGYAGRISEHNRDQHTTWMHRTAYRTVEVRIHGGTLNPHKMAGWLTALVHLQNKANDAAYAFPDTGDAAADFWAVFADSPATGKEYLATRKACGGVIRDEAYAHLEE